MVASSACMFFVSGGHLYIGSLDYHFNIVLHIPAMPIILLIRLVLPFYSMKSSASRMPPRINPLQNDCSFLYCMSGSTS